MNDENDVYLLYVDDSEARANVCDLGNMLLENYDDSAVNCVLDVTEGSFCIKREFRHTAY